VFGVVFFQEFQHWFHWNFRTETNKSLQLEGFNEGKVDWKKRVGPIDSLFCNSKCFRWTKLLQSHAEENFIPTLSLPHKPRQAP